LNPLNVWLACLLNHAHTLFSQRQTTLKKIAETLKKTEIITATWSILQYMTYFEYSRDKIQLSQYQRLTADWKLAKSSLMLPFMEELIVPFILNWETTI
jgi:hypothetical protein